jgi:hypothetical protein
MLLDPLPLPVPGSDSMESADQNDAISALDSYVFPVQAKITVSLFVDQVNALLNDKRLRLVSLSFVFFDCKLILTN